MKERPIIFSGPMVRAILDGRKTQTRRIVKPQPVGGDSIEPCGYPQDGFIVGRLRDSENAWRNIRCPYGVPGDRLWVRETWAPYDQEAIDRRERESLFYRADDERKHETDGAWRPSIHMPRWASRLTLEVVSVRVERVQAISEEDAVAEGAPFCNHGVEHDGRHYRCGFRALWDSINAKRAPWASNPWVWVIEFKREGK